MAHVEVNFSSGALRQPGMWGKFVHPGGDIYDVRMDAPEVGATKQFARKISLPDYPDGGLLLFGARGYYGAGVLTACYMLLRIQTGAVCDWQFPKHLARFQGKGVEVLAQASDDLAPIYQGVATAGFKPEQLRDALRQQGIDRQPAAEEPKR
jgi:hypothetical protein